MQSEPYKSAYDIVDGLCSRSKSEAALTWHYVRAPDRNRVTYVKYYKAALLYGIVACCQMLGEEVPEVKGLWRKSLPHLQYKLHLYSAAVNELDRPDKPSYAQNGRFAGWGKWDSMVSVVRNTVREREFVRDTKDFIRSPGREKQYDGLMCRSVPWI